MNTSEQNPIVAVVDDDPEQRRLIRLALEDSGYQVVEGETGQEAIELARRHLLDAMILDVRMPEMTGLEALQILKREHSQIVIILLTAYMDLRDAVGAIKTGAHDYLEKPIDLDELVIALEEALEVSSQEEAHPDEEVSLPEGIIAESASIRAVFHEALRAARTDVTTLLLGESGTGKEVIARYLHQHSTRSHAPFVAVNCAALPENLIESELFGHEKGAFTGAVSTRTGRFEEASSGTLLLDEIGEMPLSLQPKLLRVLEDRNIRRVGGTREIPVNVRIISATNRDLEEDARQGRFREDLLYRLNVYTIQIPPLRERRDDILPLADRFLAEQGMRDKRFSPAAQRLLLDYAWQGNVRELRNAVIRSAIISHGSLILPEDLPESIRAVKTAAEEDTVASVLVGDMEAIQKKAILEALEKTGGNKTQAARLLGISRRNLIYKLRSYGM